MKNPNPINFISSDTPYLNYIQPNTDNEIVHLHLGKPITNSVAISREFLRRHDNVLQSLDDLITDGTIGLLEFKETSYQDSQCKKQRMIELTECGALTAMPFIGGRNSRTGQVRLVKAFLALRDQMVNQNAEDWKVVRKKISISHMMMLNALQEVRAANGKSTEAHHYINEAKLVNWVLFGYFEGVVRDNLTQFDMDLMEKVEARNSIWIALGKTYGQRKVALPSYLLSLRAKNPRRLQ
ncbi:MAG: Rha family transcriptional regulator [Pseudomonadota bacterium]